MDDRRHIDKPDTASLCTVGYLQANLIAIATLALAVAFALSGHSAIWGRPAESFLDAVFASNIIFLIVGIAVIVHEVLHAIGFRYFGGAPWKSIKLGIQWRTFTPFATASVPVTARAYRWTAALPGLALGVVPVLAGVLVDAPLASGFGVMMSAGAGGDAAILWALRQAPHDTLVLDCVDAMGCQVLPAPGLGWNSASVRGTIQPGHICR